MDAVIDGIPVTPRHGYAVDLCALWIECVDFLIQMVENDLSTDSAVKEYVKSKEFLFWKTLLKNNREGFKKLFWIEEKGYLADTHNGESQDQSVRPNQLWALAIGTPLLTKADGEKLLAVVESELLTPKGLRTLSPKDPHYRGVYTGDQGQRDRAYHQGTVWPWLMGLYMDAAFFVRGQKFMSRASGLVEGLREHYYNEACFGQISEIFDGNEPWNPRGTPAQAWSVSEVLRIEVMLQKMQSATAKKPKTVSKPVSKTAAKAVGKATGKTVKKSGRKTPESRSVM
jgi:glycogen debranching enzyme